MSSFDWDDQKAEVNLRKHGVSFEEAESAIESLLSTWVADLSARAIDNRIRIVGWSAKGRLLVVIVSMSGFPPRIISARRATKRERHVYEARP